MAYHSQSSRFRGLFERALQDYEDQTGTKLAGHPLAEQLQSCNSVDSVLAILQQQAQAFTEFRGSNGRIMKSLKSAVSAIHALSTSTTLSEVISMPFPPAQAIFSGVAALLAAVKDVGASYDALVELLESIERFLNRLDIYTKISPTAAMAEMIVKIMVELLSTLALATKQVKQKRTMKLVKKLLGDNEVEAVLQRLDRLTQDEARTTAAQTLEVVYGLMQTMNVLVDDGKASIDTVRAALETIQQMASEANKMKREKLQQDVRKWLSPPDPSKNHNIARKSHHKGTAAWFADGNVFSEWKTSGPSSLLWIHGKPGAGKSVLCSSIIEDINAMQKSGLASLAFFYCDFREKDKQDLRGLLSSLLAQLCHQSDSYCEVLSKLYSEHKDGLHHPNGKTLVQCLANLLELPGKAPVYLIVDGLDEFPDTSDNPSPREEVLRLFEELVNSKLPDVRICITSRPEMDIKLALGPLNFRSVSLHDESGQIEDINNYIKSAISRDPKNRSWKAEHKQMVIDVLIKNANGIFRWVYCQQVYVRGCHRTRLRIALAELPETLDETYSRTLWQIKKSDWDFAHRLFQCVTVAFRPLRVEELAEFLAFEFKEEPSPGFHVDWRSEDPLDAVLSICSSLLSVVNEKGSSVIQLSHSSVKEFLMSDGLSKTNDKYSRRYHNSLTSTHTVVAQACLGILLHLDASVAKGGLEKFPLTEYAAEHWVDHARFGGVSANGEEGMRRLFDRKERHRDGRSLTPRGTALHYAALCGLERLVEYLVIVDPQDVHSRAFEGSTALHVASRRRHTEVVRILLERGADPTAQDKNGQTPFHFATRWGNVEVIRILLDVGADQTAQDKNGQTPFHFASLGGNVEAIRMLLERGADPTAPDKNGQTPFHLMSLNGKVEAIRILLEQGADPTAQDKNGLTPVHFASQRGNVEAIRMLLEQDGDLRAQDKNGRTASHFASLSGNVEAIRILHERGADSTAQDKNGQTPFHFASRWGNVEAIRMLLEQDADPTAHDKNGQTPLHLASLRGNVEVIRMLLERGADPTAQDKNGRTASHIASLSGNVEAIRMLLERGADPTAQDKDGQTPLHFASQRRNVEVIRMLLERGADPTGQDRNGRTPSHFASLSRNVEAIRMLLERGADPTAQDKDGQTPFHFASQSGNVEAIRILLEWGADPTAQDSDGQISLHLASRRGNVEAIRILLNRGADPTVEDKDGQIPLHLASQRGNVEAIQILLERGADQTAQDKDGQIPFHFASRWGNVEAIRILLERGADPTAQDKNGQTPFHFASLRGNVEAIWMLLERNADPTAQDKNGQTPFHFASLTGNEEVIRILLERGADPKAQDKYGQTPLHLASLRGNVDAIRVLLEQGADLTAQAMDGQTPFHFASQRENVEAIRMLLEQGADPTARDKNGRTPLHLASLRGNVEMIRILLEKGADPTAQDKDSRTPFYIASRRRNVEAIGILREWDRTAQGENDRTPPKNALAGLYHCIVQYLLR